MKPSCHPPSVAFTRSTPKLLGALGTISQKSAALRKAGVRSITPDYCELTYNFKQFLNQRTHTKISDYVNG